MRILISGGPTREFLDDVRYLGNPSTGAMGIAVAEAARDLGHLSVLVLGPTSLADPDGVEVVRVVSALEMRDAMIARWPQADALVMTAAVSDYRPRQRVAGKIKKGPQSLMLELAKNPDILEELGRMAGPRPVVGFALEAGSEDQALAAARAKLEVKRCSMVVLNRPGSFGGAHTEAVTLVSQDEAVVLGQPSKRSLGERIVRFLEERAGERGNT